jgi:hypothetical protein
MKCEYQEGQEAADRFEKMATLGISDVVSEVSEELEAIMRENSRNLDEMMATRKSLGSSSPAHTHDLCC